MEERFRMLNSGIMSSKTDMWATPQWLFDTINGYYHFTLDVCAVKENAKTDIFFTPEIDGLQHSWEGVCWMNPPYGATIKKWVKKACEESLSNGALVVALLPARTDTAWFWDYIVHYAKLEFLRGRLKFGDGVGSAPFPSMIAVWDNSWDIHGLPIDEVSRRNLIFKCLQHDLRGRCLK
jgi:phage N-6-adenine-methyltransferase